MRHVRGSVPLGLAVVGAAVLVPVALSGGFGSRVSAACGELGWPVTAERQPATFGEGSAGYFAWHDRVGWHVRVKAGSLAASGGSISANAKIVLGKTVASTGATLSRNARRLTFRATGAGALGSVDFTARCAAKLSFTFETGASAAPAPAGGAPTPIGGTSSALPVFLGARGQAPAGSFRLDRPGATGVAGHILVGSPCPVVGADGCPAPKPTQGTVQITTAPASRSGGGSTVVATVQSDANGAFSAKLAPGRYTLLVLGHESFPLAKPTPVEVQTGVVTLADLVLESGVR